MFEVPRIRRQTPVLPQHFDSTDLLFVEPDDEIEDTVGTIIYKPAAPSSPADEADPAHSARSALTIPASDSANSSSSKESSDE